jgi:hypothetical protein
MPTDLIKNIADRAKALILKPSETWDAIALEPADVPTLYKTWIAPLAVIGPLAAFIGMSLIGSGGFGFTVRVPFASGLGAAILSFGLSLIAVYVFAKIIDQLAPHFGAERNFEQAFKVAAYAPVAAWLAAVFQLIPALSALSVVGLYSLYLLFVGLPKLMKAPTDKAGGYTLACIGAALVLYIVIWAVASTFIGGNPVHITDARGTIVRTPSGAQVSSQVLGDANGSASAGSDLEQALGAVLGGAAASGPVVEADALRDLAPNRFAGLRRATVEVNETTAPFPSVVLVAEYGEPGEDRATLTITNSPALESMMGLMGMAAALDEETADGYRRVTRDGDDYIVAEWDETSESGTYGRTVAGRFFVAAEGRGVSMRDLERAVGEFDARRLERLPEQDR